MTVRLEKEGKVGVIVPTARPLISYDYAFLRELAARSTMPASTATCATWWFTSASEKFFSAGADVAQFAAEASASAS